MTMTNNENVANVAGRTKRMGAFTVWGKADGAAGVALLACFIVTAQTGATDPGEVAEARGWYGQNADGQKVPNGSATAYASTFNRAAKVASVLGITPTVDLIQAAAKGADGRVQAAVYDALGAALAQAKADGVKEATKAQAKAITKKALVSVAEKAAERKTTKAGNKRGTKSPDTATLAAAAVESGKGARELSAGLRLMSNTASRMAAPEGREDAWNKACKALADASEAFAVFAK